MKYIVSELGPIDRHPPGTDVTELYPAATLARLVAEGYVVEQTTAAKRKPGKEQDDRNQRDARPAVGG